MNRYKTFHIGENVVIKKANKIFFCEVVLAAIFISLFILTLPSNIGNTNNICNIVKSILF